MAAAKTTAYETKVLETAAYEIRRLRARIRELEAVGARPAAAAASTTPSVDYDEYVRERDYVHAVMRNPYSPNREHLPLWLHKLRIMEAAL